MIDVHKEIIRKNHERFQVIIVSIKRKPRISYLFLRDEMTTHVCTTNIDYIQWYLIVSLSSYLTKTINYANIYFYYFIYFINITIFYKAKVNYKGR